MLNEPSLYDVQNAIEDGNRDEAVAMLSRILSEKPSADAWYLAAKVAKDKDEAIRHLNRALLYDPEHPRARGALERLGGKVSATGGLGADLAQSVAQSTRGIPILRDLPPFAQLVVIALALFGVIVGGALAINALIEANTLELADEAPRGNQTVETFTFGDIISGLTRSGLQVADLGVSYDLEPISAQVLQMQLRRTDGSPVPAYVLIYDHRLHAAQDSANRAQFSDQYGFYRNDNLYLLLPVNWNDANQQQVVRVFNTLNASPTPTPVPPTEEP